ncbi:MAG TPA: response regulator [Vicinamibacterales bacterium]|nr:response regulator [Vicinamibacterales bacterium]
MIAVNSQVVENRNFSQMQKKSPSAHVLVVDDEALIRWSLSETLSDCGYDVQETGDGAGARSAVRDAGEAFDVVLLDFRLPDSEDLALLASLRQASPKTRIILMTAYGTPEVVRGALELGAYRVVSKPFEMHDVASLVAEAAAARQSAPKQ